MTSRFSGVIPLSLTMFRENGLVDESLQRAFLEYQLEAGVHALFVCGTYGSGPLMPPAQRKKLCDIAVSQARSRIPVMVHVGTADTETAIELAQHAESVGAAAVASVPPFYFAHSEESIINHFSALVRSVGIPVFAYNNPKTTGFVISPSLAVELGMIGVVGMKDSSFDIISFVQTMDKAREAGVDFEMIIGTEALWCPAALAGAQAMVAGVANVFPELVVDFYNQTVENGVQAASSMQPRFMRIRDMLKIGPTIPTCHAMLELRGLPAGRPRLPFEPINAAQKEKVRSAMIEEGLL